MPFIKLSETLYVNSDHVRCVKFISDQTAQIIYHGNPNQNLNPIPEAISAEAAAYFLAEVDARSAMASPETAPQMPSLKTRIAQALRYDHPDGTTLIGLIASDKFTNDKAEDIANAIRALESERVVIFGGISEDDPGAYYHTANFSLLTQSPDPSDADADKS